MCYGLFVRHAYMHTASYACILMSFEGKNHVQIQIKCKILMLFLDQNCRLFRMVHFTVGSVLYAENGGWMQAQFW
jgi:hypothetical protein